MNIICQNRNNPVAHSLSAATGFPSVRGGRGVMTMIAAILAVLVLAAALEDRLGPLAANALAKSTLSNNVEWHGNSGRIVR